MPFDRPTLQQLWDRTSADLSSRFGIGPLLRRSKLRILSRVWSGMVHSLHGHLDYIARQILPDTADAEHLERHASIWGISRLAATPATGTLRFLGTNGTNIPAGTLVVRADGAQFSTDALGIISGGQVDVAITAVDAGDDGNTAVGAQTSLVTPIPGVQSPQTVQDDGSGNGLTGGTDQETDEGLRDRLLLRLQNPGQAGADADYISWAREVAGVTRVWVVPLWAGEGTVQVYFARDNDSDGPIPSAGEVAAVQAHIDAVAPVTATVTVTAPVLLELDPTITLVPNTTAVQDAVASNLDDLFKREATVEGAAHTFPVSKIREAISTAVGEDDHVLTAPAADVAVAAGELLVTGTPVFS